MLPTLSLLVTAALAQPTPPAPPPPPTALADARAGHRLQQGGMAVLAGFAVGNLTTGSVGWATAEAPRPRAFHQGNTLWNTVNLGIAGASLLGTPRPLDPLDVEAAWRRSRNLDRALAVNAGLDVLYMAGGVVLQQAGARREDPRLQGWGDALLLQGGFLLTFDATLLLLHRRITRRLRGHR